MLMRTISRQRRRHANIKCIKGIIALAIGSASLLQGAAAASYISATYYGYQQPTEYRFGILEIGLVVVVGVAVVAGIAWLVEELDREARQRRAAQAARQEYLNSPEFLDQEATRLRAQ